MIFVTFIQTRLAVKLRLARGFSCILTGRMSELLKLLARKLRLSICSYED